MAIPQRPRGYAVWASASLVAIAIIGLLVAWSGLYNVAASRGHWTVVAQLLRFGMKQSVDTHSLLVEAPKSYSDGMRRLGGAHYHLACVQCHGAPGFAPNPITAGMLPEPPYLVGRIREWKSRHLFWITKHGLKYTGMPAWPVQSRDDEVWSVVAFLRHLPSLSPADYLAFVSGNAHGRPSTGRSGEVYSGTATPKDCSRCHGDAEHSPTSPLVPRLAGQRLSYLRKALEEYASGVRPSGIMQPIASTLTATHIEQLAQHYADLRRSATAKPVRSGASDIGERIARFGLRADAVPACFSCHDGPRTDPSFPRLAGQSAEYIRLQLRLWRSGTRSTSAEAALMTTIAKRLPETAVDALAGYFSSLAPMGTAGEPRSTLGEEGTQ